MTIPSEYTTLTLTTGQQFFWFRYAGWLATCPVMLELLCRIVVPRKPSTDMLMKVLICDLLLLITGITSALMKNLAFKFTMFAFGGVMLAIIYVSIYRVFALSNSRRRGIPHNQMAYRRNVMLLTFFSWTLFPILFLLGPETFGVITIEYSIVGHVCGDIVSKNLYSFISWHFRNVFMRRADNVASNSAATSMNGSSSTLGSETTRDFDSFSLSQISGFGKMRAKQKAKKASRNQTSHHSSRSPKRQNSLPQVQRQNSMTKKDLDRMGSADPTPGHNSAQWKQRQQQYAPTGAGAPDESDTDISEWNPAQQNDRPLTAAELKAGMRSEWESNLTLSQEAQAPPPRPIKKQSSRTSTHSHQGVGNEGFLDNL
jgi:bacteriorhodopsin